MGGRAGALKCGLAGELRPVDDAGSVYQHLNPVSCVNTRFAPCTSLWHTLCQPCKVPGGHACSMPMPSCGDSQHTITNQSSMHISNH